MFLVSRSASFLLLFFFSLVLVPWGGQQQAASFGEKDGSRQPRAHTLLSAEPQTAQTESDSLSFSFTTPSRFSPSAVHGVVESDVAV